MKKPYITNQQRVLELIEYPNFPFHECDTAEIREKLPILAQAYEELRQTIPERELIYKRSQRSKVYARVRHTVEMAQRRLDTVVKQVDIDQ